MTEKEKSMAGMLYKAFPGELYEDRNRIRDVVSRFNYQIPYTDFDARRALLKGLLGSFPDDDPPFIEPPFRCDYGWAPCPGRQAVPYVLSLAGFDTGSV